MEVVGGIVFFILGLFVLGGVVLALSKKPKRKQVFLESESTKHDGVFSDLEKD